MNKENKVLAVFDIDGTLLISGGAGNRSIDRAFEAIFSLKNATEDIDFIGRTDRSIFAEIAKSKLGHTLREGDIEKVKLLYLKYLRDEVENSKGFKVLSGARELLDRLSLMDNVLIGIATGNIEEGARIKLRKAKIEQYFSFGGFDAVSYTHLTLPTN